MRSLSIILHNIRSAYNVGAMLRTADGVGVSPVYLTGYTPAPVDRFGRKRADIAKVALGAENTVLWESVEEVTTLLTRLAAEKVTVVAVEQDARSVRYTDYRFPQGPCAFMFGDEVLGIPREVLDLCDQVIDIPMFGAKESLNVSTAMGIITYYARLNT